MKNLFQKIAALLMVAGALARPAFALTYTTDNPPAYSATYVKATTNAGDPEYLPHNAVNPSSTLTSSWSNNSWVSNGTTNQRFHIDIGAAAIIRRIYYQNANNAGGNFDNGCKNFTFWGSNDAGAFAELTYGTDTNWTQLTIDDSQFDQHAACDCSDPKYVLVSNDTAYRYYAIKVADNWGGGFYMSLRHVELQTEDGYTPGGGGATTHASVMDES